MTWTLVDLQSALTHGLTVKPTAIGFKLSCNNVACGSCPIEHQCHARYTANHPDLLTLLQTHYPEQLL